MGLVSCGSAPEGRRARLAQERNASARRETHTAYILPLSTHRLLPISGGERTTASATPRRLRILEDEALLHQVLVIIQRRVVKVEIALGIHENTRAVFFEHFIAVARLGIQTHRVAQARTPAPLHAHAESTGLGRHAFFLQQLANFYRSFFRYMNHSHCPVCVHGRARLAVRGAAANNSALVSYALWLLPRASRPLRPASSSNRPTRP